MAIMSAFQAEDVGSIPITCSKARIGWHEPRSRTSENRAGESTSTQGGKPELYGDKMKV